MARSVWLIKRPQLQQLYADVIGNGPYVGSFPADSFVSFLSSEDDPDQSIPTGRDIMFVVMGHYGPHDITGADRHVVSRELRVGVGNTDTGHYSLVAPYAKPAAHREGIAFGFTYKYASYNPSNPLRVLGRLRQNTAQPHFLGGWWSVSNLSILAFDIEDEFSLAEHIEHTPALNPEINVGVARHPGSPQALGSISITRSVPETWLGFIETRIVPSGDTTPDGNVSATDLRYRITSGAGAQDDAFGDDNGLSRWAQNPPSANTDAYSRLLVAQIDQENSGAAIWLDGRTYGIGQIPVADVARIRYYAAALIPTSQANSTYLFDRLGDAVAGPNPFQVDDFVGDLGRTVSPAQVSVTNSVKWPEGEGPRNMVVVAQANMPRPAGVEISHDGQVLAQAGTAADTHPGGMAYGTGLSQVRVGTQSFTARGVWHPLLATLPDTDDAPYFRMFALLDDQSAVTGISGVVTPGPIVSLSVGGEGPALGSLNTLPIAPQSTEDLAYEGGGADFFDSEAGYVRSLPQFITARRRVRFTWRPLTDPQVKTLTDFFRAQGVAAFKTTLPNETTDRAFVVGEGRTRIQSVGFHKPRSAALGNPPFRTEGDTRAYEVVIEAVELVQLV